MCLVSLTPIVMVMGGGTSQPSWDRSDGIHVVASVGNTSFQ